MSAPAVHPFEQERLASLRSYCVPDSGSDPAIDAVTVAAARGLDVPVALVILVGEDRQWLKSSTGLASIGCSVTSRGGRISFSAHIVATGQPLLVPDATRDARFRDHELVVNAPHVRFFAGVPLVGRDGLPLGALCVLDSRVRTLDDTDLGFLVGLGATITELLELRRSDHSAGLIRRDVLQESHRLREAIERRELVVHYQPVVDLPSRRWTGVEALVRWNHPTRGLLPPSTFLPVAEASGLIVPLGRYVLGEACSQLAAWRREGAAHLQLAVNLSGRQLAEPDTPDAIAAALAGSGLPAQALTVELTETSLAGRDPGVDVTVDRIRALGPRLALDDFGTGYSTHAYLQRFHPDILKIDRCFVGGLGRSRRDDILVRALVELALQLGCAVTAEGVERPDQAAALTRLGCRSAQGYLFSAPQAAEVIERVHGYRTVW